MFSCFAAAAGVEGLIETLICLVSSLVPLLVSIAILVFFWGMVKFIAHADDEKAVTEGRQLMIWGLVGIFVIIALWSIVGYIQESLGLDVGGLGDVSAPSLPTTIP